MNTDWKQYLQNSGANIVDGVANDFGEPELELKSAPSEGGVVDLSSCGLISVSGAHAQSFLQGQLSNDLADITPGRSQLAAWCTPKGRVQVLFRVFAKTEGYGLILPREQVTESLRRLQMYRLRAKIDLVDETASSGLIGLLGGGFELMLRDRFGTLPTADNNVVSDGSSTLIRLPGALQRYWIVLPAAIREQWWTALTHLGRPLGEPAFLLTEILAAQPRVFGDNIGEFVPQMLNLERIGAISFTKGCYVGQEIVARTQHLGRIKRRMYLCRLEHGPPRAGTELWCAEAPQTKGRLVMAAPHPDGGALALAVLPVDTAQSQQWRVSADNGETVRLLPLPYALSDD